MPTAAELARSAPADALPALLHNASDDVLFALLENPRLDLSHLEILLKRKDLSSRLLEEISRHKKWLAEYSVRRALALHPHTPRLIAMRVLRQLYLMDVVQASVLPSVPAELRRIADELLVARLPQLPLGQKLTLARRASARVAGALLAEGHDRVARIALENTFLTEAQVLRALASAKLPARVVEAVARHGKWSARAEVHLALLRHPQMPLALRLTFLQELPLRALETLADTSSLPANLRKYFRAELSRRRSRP